VSDRITDSLSQSFYLTPDTSKHQEPLRRCPWRALRETMVLKAPRTKSQEPNKSEINKSAIFLSKEL
jgi:hypothetical protein